MIRIATIIGLILLAIVQFKANQEYKRQILILKDFVDSCTPDLPKQHLRIYRRLNGSIVCQKGEKAI